MKTKLLYVEDELALAGIVKDTLESKGYEVYHVSHGNEVISAFKTYKPSLCILDVMLPGTDGFSLGKIIYGENPDIPIIFLTAKNQTEDVLNGFQSGGRDYLKTNFCPSGAYHFAAHHFGAHPTGGGHAGGYL